MLTAELTVLVHFKSVRIVLLVFLGIIVSLLAFCACESNLNPYIISHLTAPSYYIDLTLRLCVPPSYDKAGLSVRGAHVHNKKASAAEVFILYHISLRLSILFSENFPFLQKYFFGA